MPDIFFGELLNMDTYLWKIKRIVFFKWFLISSCHYMTTYVARVAGDGGGGGGVGVGVGGDVIFNHIKDENRRPRCTHATHYPHPSTE